MGWTLFCAEHHTSDGDPCWSAAIGRDLRAMPKNRREAWLALLDCQRSRPAVLQFAAETNHEAA